MHTACTAPSFLAPACMHLARPWNPPPGRSQSPLARLTTSGDALTTWDFLESTTNLSNPRFHLAFASDLSRTDLTSDTRGSLDHTSVYPGP